METTAEDVQIDGRTLVVARPTATGPWPGVVMMAADGFKASAVNYGVTSGMTPANIDQIASRACPIVASYGAHDRMAEVVPTLQAALAAHNVPHDVKVYPSAGHAFLNDALNGPRVIRPLAKLMHAGPEPVADADAWRRIEAFFAEHVGPPGASS